VTPLAVKSFHLFDPFRASHDAQGRVELPGQVHNGLGHDECRGGDEKQPRLFNACGLENNGLTCVAVNHRESRLFGLLNLSVVEIDQYKWMIQGAQDPRYMSADPATARDDDVVVESRFGKVDGLHGFTFEPPLAK